MLIDTHCHINFADAFPEPDEAINEAVADGVGVMVAVGCDLESGRLAVGLADRRSEVYAVVGLHPNYTSGYRRQVLEEFRPLLNHPRTVALGEVGLDYHWTYAERDEQHEALRDQLALAEELGKPVVFHCREAYDDLLSVLEGTQPRQRCLFHCFSGNLDQATRAVKLDAWFGVDGPITYKSAHDLRDLVRTLPRERLVVETDSPYMTPVPHRGKPNRPSYVKYVNRGLAACLGISEDECAELTTANAKAFFGF